MMHEVAAAAESEDLPAVITLNRASRLVPRLSGRRSNYVPLLETLCRKAGIDVRYDDGGSPCCRSSDLPRIVALVDRHYERTRTWPRRVHKTVGGSR